jgi:hypothetical protein
VADWPPWIGLPNLEANLQQPGGWNNQDAPAQPAHEDDHEAPAQPKEDVQLRSTWQRKPPSYLHDFVTGRSIILLLYLYCMYIQHMMELYLHSPTCLHGIVHH